MEVGLGSGDFLFDGDPAAREQMAHSPPASFWPMFIVIGHTADGWMTTPLSTEVDLGQTILY